MRKCFFLSLYLLFYFASFAQKDIPEFGKSSIEDLQLKACGFEPGAIAMKLFDVTETEFEYNEYGTRIKTEKRIRIKIFKEDGYHFASIKIPYYTKRGISKIKALKGVVYNLDEAGNVVAQKLESKDFFRNKPDDNVGMINFTFPDLKPGSVVEYSYTRIENDIIQLDPWDVQDEIPVLYTANIIVVPQESRIKEKYYGFDTVDHMTQKISGGREKQIYYKENVSSFHTEPYMTSVRDNLMRMAYFLIPRSNAFIDLMTAPDKVWDIIGNQLLYSRFFMGQIATDIPGTDSLLKTAKSMTSVPARIKYLLDAVKSHAPENIEQTFFPLNILEAWKNNSGSTAELNLILINLLRRAGVPCFPLLVSTRYHGTVRADFPGIGQFNGLDVVAKDSGKTYILDAGIKSQTLAVPPPNVLNRVGLLLNEQQIQWMAIVDARPLIKQNISVLSLLHEDGSLTGKTTTVLYDYAKMALLDSGSRETSMAIKMTPGDLRTISYKITGSADNDEPAKKETVFEWQGQKTGEFYFAKPQIFTAFERNPFESAIRNTDIDFGCNQEVSLSLHIEIPPATVVEFLPKDVSLSSTNAAFVYKRVCSQTASAILFTQTFQIKRSQFYKEDYPAIKDFFKKVYGLMAEEIIFKEKK